MVSGAASSYIIIRSWHFCKTDHLTTFKCIGPSPVPEVAREFDSWVSMYTLLLILMDGLLKKTSQIMFNQHHQHPQCNFNFQFEVSTFQFEVLASFSSVNCHERQSLTNTNWWIQPGDFCRGFGCWMRRNLRGVGQNKRENVVAQKNLFGQDLWPGVTAKWNFV